VTELVLVELRPRPGRELRGGTTVGREGCDVVLGEDLSVSRRHAAVVELESGLAVRDLGSSNGTWLNGRQIQASEPLRPGDELAVGDAVWRVEQRGGAGAGSAFPATAAPRGDVPAPRQSAVGRLPVPAPDDEFSPPASRRRRAGSAATRIGATAVSVCVFALAVAILVVHLLTR
jgi:predicted component of type VI protein secretion system